MRTGRVVGAALLTLVTLLVAAGCSSTPPVRPPGTPAPVTVSPPPGATPVVVSVVTGSPDISFSACGAGASVLRLTDASAHVRLDGWVIGPATAKTAVVFLHQAGGPQGACGWWDYGRWLSRSASVRAYLVQRCGYGSSSCPRQLSGAAQNRAETQPAVDDARRHGASRVVLVGASAGAADAIADASLLSGVDAVVALSADITDTDAPIAANRDRLPTLMAYANNDRYCPPAQQKAWFASIPARHKRLITGTEALHGWDLVATDDGFVTPVGRSVASWVAGRYG